MSQHHCGSEVHEGVRRACPHPVCRTAQAARDAAEKWVADRKARGETAPATMADVNRIVAETVVKKLLGG